MKELLAAGTQLQGETGEVGILWWVDDTFAQVMDPERHSRVQGEGFGQTPFGNYMRILEECTPPSASTKMDQKVKEMTIQIASLEEKCHGFESLKAEMSLMKKMFSQMNPLFTFAQVKNFKVH